MSCIYKVLSLASCDYMMHDFASFQPTAIERSQVLVTSRHRIAALMHARNTSTAAVLVITSSERE